jgi:hypothetical protein
MFEGVKGIEGLKIATAGSCFAQHIGRALKQRGLSYVDYEPPPEFLTPEAAEQHGYGIYSCRYGNIYTVRQLLQLFQESFGERRPETVIWEASGRFYDRLRPAVLPGGTATAEEIDVLRAAHLAAVNRMFLEVDLFVFTLGLTEAWINKSDGTVFPTAPGVIAGRFDPAETQFKNFRYQEILGDLEKFLDVLARVNSKCRVLLTVSPVPLAATATGDHVLVASTYSKCVLRAVAGDIARDRSNVTYFPSYELITGPQARYAYFNPDLRTVAASGVSEVMRHFFGSFADRGSNGSYEPSPIVGYEHCEEMLNDPGLKP